jgi:hypothetical protein
MALKRPGRQSSNTRDPTVEAFEGNARDMGFEDASEGVVGRSAGAGVIDASEVGVEIEEIRHLATAPCVKRMPLNTG